MKKQTKFLASGLLAATVLTLTACGDNAPTGGNNANNQTQQGGGNATTGGNTGDVVVVDAANALASLDAAFAMFPQYYDNNLPHVDGTVFQFGLAQASPITGLFGTSVFWHSNDDNIIGSMLGTVSSLLSTSEMFQFGQDGIVNYSVDQANSSITFTMQHDVYWHDGAPLTLDDWVFAFEIMAHPDYSGIRFSGANRQITGIMDFHNGDVDSISGLVLSNNNRTLTIHFDELSPTVLYFGIHTSPVPRHVFANIPVADIPSSPQAQTLAIGWGPFILENVVPGESVYMRRNENFVFGAPYVESLILRRVAPELALAGMAAGTFDMINQVNAAYFGDHRTPSNFQYIGQTTGWYSYISFRMGTWDAENNVNVYNPERLMNQLGAEFRQAMALAVDHDLLGETLFNGLEFIAGSNIAPLNRAFIDASVPGFGYNTTRANEILDAAGFTERDSDGYRMTPAGEPLTVIWAQPTNPLEDIIVPFHLQGWASIGIRVELWRGQTHDQGYLWDVLDFDTDNQEIHIYTGAWTSAFDPDPSGRWGHAMWNPARHTSAEQDAIFERITSEATWDSAYLMQVLSDWQWYWYNTVPYFPTRWRVDLLATNNRVAGVEPRPYVGHSSAILWHQLRLTAANPY